jgi:hypothetical protein
MDETRPGRLADHIAALLLQRLAAQHLCRRTGVSGLALG